MFWGDLVTLKNFLLGHNLLLDFLIWDMVKKGASFWEWIEKHLDDLDGKQRARKRSFFGFGG